MYIVSVLVCLCVCVCSCWCWCTYMCVCVWLCVCPCVQIRLHDLKPDKQFVTLKVCTPTCALCGVVSAWSGVAIMCLPFRVVLYGAYRRDVDRHVCNGPLILTPLHTI